MISYHLTYMGGQAQNVRIMWSVWVFCPIQSMVSYASCVQGSVLPGMSFVLPAATAPSSRGGPHSRPEVQAEEYEKRELSLDITLGFFSETDHSIKGGMVKTIKGSFPKTSGGRQEVW